MELETELNHSSNQKKLEIGKSAEPGSELKPPPSSETKTDIKIKIETLKTDIQTENGEETTVRGSEEIETVYTPKYTIQINKTKLEKIQEGYGISDWDIQFNPKFSLNRNRVNWNNKIITIRPFNFWSYVFVGTSIDKRNERLPKILAHEIRHVQQKPPDNLLKEYLSSAKYAYWFHPQEIDARKWSDEHWGEFKDIIKISRK